MARPEFLDATAPDLAWRRVPMPGANQGVDVVPLASAGVTTTMLVRFPEDFERATAGGYHAAEEVVVLTGELCLEGVAYGPGAWLHLPAGLLRTDMRTAVGATVLAWFGGPIDFRAPDELTPTASGITARELAQLADGATWQTPESNWRLAAGSARRDGEEGLDVSAMTWVRGAPTPECDRMLLREPR